MPPCSCLLSDGRPALASLRCAPSRACKMVFIGRNLDPQALAARFNACLATPENLKRKADALRFRVGQRVECNFGATWAPGTVVAYAGPQAPTRFDAPAVPCPASTRLLCPSPGSWLPLLGLVSLIGMSSCVLPAGSCGAGMAWSRGSSRRTKSSSMRTSQTALPTSSLPPATTTASSALSSQRSQERSQGLQFNSSLPPVTTTASSALRAHEEVVRWTAVSGSPNLPPSQPNLVFAPRWRRDAAPSIWSGPDYW